METDSIISRAGSNTRPVVTLLGITPTGPFLPGKPSTHTPPTLPEENSCSRPHGSEAVTWGGDREGWQTHWAGSQFLGHVS